MIGDSYLSFFMSMILAGFWKVALGYMTICISSSIV